MSGLYRRYLGYTGRVLDEVYEGLDHYRDVLAGQIKAGDRLLHVGCGWDRSGVARPYLDRCEIVGVDLDQPSAADYPGAFWLADAARLPFGDQTFDLAFSEYVLEHVADPDGLLEEVGRVLRPGGLFVVLTPNLWSYKSLGAAAMPHRVHELAARYLRLDRREAKDTFPTLYRMNTEADIRRLARLHGFRVQEVRFVSNGPTFFARVPGLFEAGRLLHWGMDHVEAMGWLRCSLVAVLRRDEAASGTRRAELSIRCIGCGVEGMTKEEGGWRCASCGRRYPVTGHVTEALPKR